MDFGIVDVVDSGLCPIGPETETEADFMGVGGDCGDAVREFVGIGCPIADGAEPTGIEVEHVQAERVGVVDHVMRLLFVDGHAAAPTVADQQGYCGLRECERVIQSGANPAAKNVAGVVGITMERAEEDGGRSKVSPGRVCGRTGRVRFAGE